MDRKIAGVVLAGGQSSRMGQDKAFLDYNGKPLLDHMIHILKQAGLSNIYVSGDFEGYNSIPDSAPYAGPAYAMHNILQQLAHYDGVLFVPVDMPLLHINALHLLLKQETGAYFNNAPLPVFISNISDKKRSKSVKGFLSDLNVPSIILPSELEFCMANTNTPEEWKGALQT